jgi:hypothetical protein
LAQSGHPDWQAVVHSNHVFQSEMETPTIFQLLLIDTGLGVMEILSTGRRASYQKTRQSYNDVTNI